MGNIAETMTAQYETINGESIIDFMTKLRGQYGLKTVHLILDRSGCYHRSMLVAENTIKLNIKGCRSFRTTKNQNYSLIINELIF